ncbi:unnamed protein product, partial [Meganyctiphanes norvegica]
SFTLLLLRPHRIQAMAKVSVALALLALVAVCLGRPSELPPYGPPPPPYGGYPAPHKEPGMPYAYQYAVKDDYQGVDFGANEESDGELVSGSYNVALPDGRIQIVSYTSDHYKGYQANVAYEGEAQFPAPSPYGPPPPAPYGPPPPPPYGPPPPPPYEAPVEEEAAPYEAPAEE